MSGIAALVVSTAPVNERIHVYYNTDTKNLGLTMKNGDKDGEDPSKSFASSADDQKVIIPNPSQIGASHLLGMNLVVGIANQAACGATKNDVAIISPVYKPLGSTEAYNLVVSICSSDTAKEAWVYYLTGPDANSIKFHEYSLYDFSTEQRAGNDNILKGSSLAAYYNTDDEKRYVIHQGRNPQDLYEICIDDRSTTRIESTDNALKSTPLAVVFHEKTAYLYYLNSGNKIERIKNTGSEWGSPHSLDKEADSAHQLSAVWLDGIPHLFYVSPSGLSHIRDKKASK
ncbi:hypothetical protein QBC38DRAFT_517343 [Podospora fimiseda]|uniref:Fucose-specific lectin n=1 Tax=Podospora fimiseda TaxID=252190 RepID=A0AAN7GWK2_9PEZI|nr:hypothetical protein QBC38DRAFT_517343 [Podospora fimiseda]